MKKLGRWSMSMLPEEYDERAESAHILRGRTPGFRHACRHAWHAKIFGRQVQTGCRFDSQQEIMILKTSDNFSVIQPGYLEVNVSKFSPSHIHDLCSASGSLPPSCHTSPVLAVAV